MMAVIFSRRSLLTLGALLLCAGACGSGPSTLQQAHTSGVVRIGYANEAPFAYMDVVSGRVTGEAPEIARVILARMGIRHVEAVLTEFGSLIPGLQAGRFDIIAAGMYILPQRCHEIRFSNPSYSTGEALVVKRGNRNRLHSLADVVQHPQVRIGVVAGTVEASYAQASGIPAAQLVMFPDDPSAMEGLLAGRIEAFAASRPAARHLLGLVTDDAAEEAQPFTDPVIGGHTVRGYGAFGFRQADGDFADAFNQALHGFIGSKEHLRLIQPFGFTAQELPGPASAAALCRQQH